MPSLIFMLRYLSLSLSRTHTHLLIIFFSFFFLNALWARYWPNFLEAWRLLLAQALGLWMVASKAWSYSIPSTTWMLSLISCKRSSPFSCSFPSCAHRVCCWLSLVLIPSQWSLARRHHALGIYEGPEETLSAVHHAIGQLPGHLQRHFPKRPSAATLL